MSRSEVSVVVAAGGSPDGLRICLESVRQSVREGDEVVCVVPPGRQDLGPVLAGADWLTVVPAADATAGGVWGAGVDATAHPLVALLDGDVLVPPYWLEPVAAALETPGVAAAGPRCHRGAGPQAADVPRDAARTLAAFREFAAGWRDRHTGRVLTAERLGPVCTVLRRSALTAAGGPGGDTLWERLREHGSLVVVHEAVVAHLAEAGCAARGFTAAPGPFLSAVVLARDEADNLADCLSAARRFADELVVHDLGSSDLTRAIAAEHGAVVVPGVDDGDLGAARSRAVDHATGEWVLLLEADERAAGDRKAVRGRLLFAGVDTIALTARPDDESRSVAGMRLFRRSAVRFDGRAHEQVVDRVTGEPIETHPHLDLLTLTYPAGSPDSGNARNLRAPQRSRADLDAEAAALLKRARTSIEADDFAAAAGLCRDVLASDARGGVHDAALKTLLNSLIPLGELAAANRALDDLRDTTASAWEADTWEARLRFAEQDFAGAVECARRLPVQEQTRRDQLAEIEIKSLFALGRHREAAELLRACLTAGTVPLTVAEMAEALAADGTTLAEAVARVPEGQRRTLLYAARNAPVEYADQVLEALWELPGEQAAVLGVAGPLGRYLPLHRAVLWSARMREHGLAQHCPLLRLAAQPERGAVERVLAAAVALERHGDAAAVPLLADALDAVPAEEEAAVLAELRQHAPGVADSVEPAPAL